MKKIHPMKVWVMGKRMRDVYPYATKWEVFKFKVSKVINIAALISFFTGAVMGAYNLGGVMNPSISYAVKEVPTKDTTPAPVLERIAKCESGGKQFNTDGSVIRGKVNRDDVGIMQINITLWEQKAHDLGYDLWTENGNRAMAQYIFEHQGTSPWQSSAKCWNK